MKRCDLLVVESTKKLFLPGANVSLRTLANGGIHFQLTELGFSPGERVSLILTEDLEQLLRKAKKKNGRNRK